MNIVVMEWLACGGQVAAAAESLTAPEPSKVGTCQLMSKDLGDSLLIEGLEMLVAVALGASKAGMQVTAPISSHVREASGCQTQLGDLGGMARVVELPGEDLSPRDLVLQWAKLLDDADCGIVIAPELNETLSFVLSSLREYSRTPLLNCADPCLQIACDKSRTASICEAHSIMHPATVTGVAGPELDRCVHQVFGQERGEVVAKPRYGAGATSVFAGPSWDAIKGRLDPGNEYVVQSFVEGENYSCHVVVSNLGEWHWLPAMCQDIRVVQPGLSAGTKTGVRMLEFSGVRQAGESLRGLAAMQVCLKQAFRDGALGWLGFDLVRQIRTGEWYLIECNARCTTSLSVLAKHDPKFSQCVFEWMLQT
ncbi:MAG: ATP-grasp domain-containing protein [Aureliella sp.]